MASLRSLRPLLAVGLLLPAACSPEQRPPSAILITLDTMRADALGCYGQELRITPSLDVLASRGVVFENAMTSVPLTLPAHASALTGLYPPRHTVRINGETSLPRSAETLAERAREAGCRTAAFVGASVLDPGFGLDQGFEVYSSVKVGGAHGHAHGHEGGQRPGTEVIREAITWLRSLESDEPFFLWIHLFGAHDPYEPDELFRAPPGVHPYYGDVAMTDACVGGLLGWLDEVELIDEVNVLVVGDHGEALGQHGEATHGDYVYEPTMRIPLILAGPGIPAGERRTDLVSIVDVAPTWNRSAPHPC